MIKVLSRPSESTKQIFHYTLEDICLGQKISHREPVVLVQSSVNVSLCHRSALQLLVGMAPVPLKGDQSRFKQFCVPVQHTVKCPLSTALTEYPTRQIFGSQSHPKWFGHSLPLATNMHGCAHLLFIIMHFHHSLAYYEQQLTRVGAQPGI